MQKTALIFGVTGLTGSLVLEQLLLDKNYTSVKLFSRKPSGVSHPKVTEYIGDLLNLETLKNDIVGNDVYICIGTTKKKTPNHEMYRKIDFGIPSNIAGICKTNGVSKLAVVSAIGANSKSTIPYNKIKGEMEEAINNSGIDFIYILRPSFISGKRNENRAGERIGLAIFKILKFLIPKKYRAVEAKSIAKRMITLCQSDEPSQIIESNEI